MTTLSLTDLTQARRKTAEKEFECAKFPCPVSAFNGWAYTQTTDACTWSRRVYLENDDPDEPSIPCTFNVHFPKDESSPHACRCEVSFS